MWISSRVWWCRFSRAALLATLSLGPAGLLAAQGTAAPPRPLPQGSISGTLVGVETRRSGIIIRDDAGKQMAWRLDPSVVKELAAFKPGDRLWIIYRQISGDRAVTAIGFPGTAPKPVFHNATGGAVQLVTGPFVGGACSGVREPADLHEYRILRTRSVEVTDESPCWCCAPFGETCEPANRAWEPGDKVTGKIILSRCFTGR